MKTLMSSTPRLIALSAALTLTIPTLIAPTAEATEAPFNIPSSQHPQEGTPISVSTDNGVVRFHASRGHFEVSPDGLSYIDEHGKKTTGRKTTISTSNGQEITLNTRLTDPTTIEVTGTSSTTANPTPDIAALGRPIAAPMTSRQCWAAFAQFTIAGIVGAIQPETLAAIAGVLGTSIGTVAACWDDYIGGH